MLHIEIYQYDYFKRRIGILERTHALELVKKHIRTKNLLKHMLATEAVMKELARRFGEDEKSWGLCGLVHDIDYDQTSDSPEEHGLIGAEILGECGFSLEILQAVKAHAGQSQRESLMDKALYASDPLTGLIVASALIHPDKKLKSIDASFVNNRFGEKGFARGANRDAMKSCEDMGLTLDEFIGIGLNAMQEIDSELGL